MTTDVTAGRRSYLGAMLAAAGTGGVGAALLADPVRGEPLSIGWTELLCLVLGVGCLVASLPGIRRSFASLRARSIAETPAAHLSLTRHPLRMVIYSVWFAAIISLTEDALRAYEKVLGWRMVPLDLLWKIPLAYFFVFLGVGSILWALARRWPTRPLVRGLAFAGFAIGLSSTVLIAASGVLDVAAVLLAVGASVQLTRLADRHLYALHTVASRTIAALTLICAVVAAGTFAWPKWQESRALAKLPTAAPAAPNVLLIVLDTVRAQSMSLYGYGRPTTPRLARFAERGIVFDRALATAPWTLPSHGSMFTGQYPHRLTAGWSAPLDDRHQTLAEALSAEGYLTAGFVANFVYGGAEYGLSRGFAHYEAHPPSLAAALAATSPGREFLESLRESEILDVAHAEFKPAPQLNRDFLQWLAARDGGRPYFAFLNYFDAHAPYPPPPDFTMRFSAGTFYRNPWSRPLDRWGAEEVRGFNNAYDDAVSYVDDQVGRLLDTLDERGELENSLVIVTSDHGEQFGEHGLIDHSASLYMPLLHVPLLIVYPPRVGAGVRVSDPVTLRNLPRTILDLIGSRGQTTIPGASLIDPRTGRPSIPSEAPLSETARTTAAYPSTYPARTGRMRSIVVEGMHFIKNYGSGREELYDVMSDSAETYDLAASRPDLVTRYRAQLALAVESR